MLTKSKANTTPGPEETVIPPLREEKLIIKVAVLNEPYFPKQKLSIKFNRMVLKHMDMENESTFKQSGSLHGQTFGIVQKMDKSFRSYAKYGSICEIVGESSTTVIFNSNQKDASMSV